MVFIKKEKALKNDSAAAVSESQQNMIKIVSDSLHPEVLIQVNQLINWMNTHTAHQSKGGPNTKTFMDGYCLIQGLQTQLENSQRSNVSRDIQVSNANTEKSALEQENDRLRRQLREQSAQVEKFKKRNAKLENHEKKIAIREVMPLGKLKCKVANLQVVFDTLVSKLENEPLNKEDALYVQGKQELGEFRRDVGDLFGRVQHNMIKWEKNQKEMVGKLERTRVGLNNLNEIVMSSPLHAHIMQPSTSKMTIPTTEMHPITSLQTNMQSSSKVIHSTGNMNLKSTNPLSKSIGCKYKAKQKLSDISVKTVLLKHLKSQKSRKLNQELASSSYYQFRDSYESTSVVSFNGLSQPILHISNPSNAEGNARAPNNVGENTSSPKKPKSPIVCGLCGTGFSTLLQLKLHHAVFHSSKSTGLAVGHETQHNSSRLQASGHQNLERSNEAVHFAQYLSARQANQGASTSATANMEQHLMQYLMDLAAGISTPSAPNSDLCPRHENDK